MKRIIGFYTKSDLITILGTLFAIIGIILTINEHYTISAFCMIFCWICNAYDERLDQKQKSSKIERTYGLQLDSLSNVICFAVFPSLLTSTISNTIITKFICAFYMLCGLINLAYYNTISLTGKNEKDSHVGIPITTISVIYPIIFLIIRTINFELLIDVMPYILFILGILLILKIRIPKINKANIINKVLNKYVINYIIFPLYILLSTDIFYRLTNNNLLNSIKVSLINLWEHIFSTILFIIIINMILLILNALLKSSKKAKIVMIILSVGLITISDIKYNIMGIPLVVSDINYLNPANMAMMETASGSIGTWIIITMIKAIIVTLMSVIIFIVKKNKIIKINNNKTRIIITPLAIVVLLILFMANAKNNTFIIEKIYDTSSEKILSYNTVNELYNEHGFFQGMYLNAIYDNKYMPKDYNMPKVQALLNDKLLNNSNDISWGKANVVFILSEAFSDLENINEIKFNKSLTPNIDSYKNSKDKVVMDLLVPTYGGSSVNTEFEILTGASLSLWQSGYIPYNQYYNTFNATRAPHLINEFNNNGYETIYLTPWAASSYKSKFVYQSIGTDKTIYNLKGENKGKYLSDKSLMEAIYEELKDTGDGNYKFIMSASSQNHFPYDGNIYDRYDINIKESNYNEEDRKILRNYAQGIYDADKELNNLYKKIQKLDTPTIIVFFGDHLPYTLNSVGTDPYTGAAYFNTEDNEINLLRKYTTKAVILSNYNIELDNLEYINASYLGAYILNKMDLKISNYFKFIDNMRKEIPVFNRNIIYKDYKIYNINNLEQEMFELLNDYKYVQYGSFYEYIK